MTQPSSNTRAAALWPQLMARAGLTGPRSGRMGAYDRELVDGLREKLFPDASDPIEALLEASDLTAEALIRAFFQTLAPFAQMKVDILKMLAAAGAHGSGDSLAIRFNFDPEQEPLDLLLEQFRTQMESLAEIVKERVASPGYSELWQLPKAGGIDPYGDAWPAGTHRTPGFAAWLETYAAGSLVDLPTDWVTGREDVDDRIGRVVALANSYLTAFRRYGSTHETLRSAGYAGDAETEDPIGMSVRQLWVLESDYWPRAIAHWILHVRSLVTSADEAGLVRVMDEVDAILPPASFLVTEWINQLEEVLNLPVWRHRHEVYAVWLGAQIFQALKDDWRFTFHLVEGRMEFAFRGVHLATLTSDHDAVLFWWTELGTEHKALPSGHRVKGVQPDYRIRAAPLSQRDPDVLVVEAKQHLRSSTREFVDALNDYAFACPNAAVLLANHGPVSASVIIKTTAEHQRRCATHARLHPGEPANVSAFRCNVAHGLKSALSGEPWVHADTDIQVELRWAAAPSDLDLHVTREDGNAHVSYRQHEAEGLRYEDDVTRGFGPERARITNSEGVYTVLVHRFSGDGELKDSEAEVEIVFWERGTSRHVKFQVPRDLKGDQWRVAQIDAARRMATPFGTECGQLRPSAPTF